MKNKEIYHKIVSQNNFDELKIILEKEFSSIGYDLLGFEILYDKDFPYIYCSVDTEELFAAMMIGLLIDIRHLIPEYKKKIYYLPVAAFCETYPDKVSQYVNKKNSINHELLHVKDILNLIEEDPEYPEKISKFGKQGTIKIKDLPTSIDLEIFKIFYIEPQAIKLDYDAGENYILLPLKNGEIYRHICDDVQQVMMVKMASELSRVEKIYLNKFSNTPTAEETISTEFKKAISKYGGNIFDDKLDHGYPVAAG